MVALPYAAVYRQGYPAKLYGFQAVMSRMKVGRLRFLGWRTRGCGWWAAEKEELHIGGCCLLWAVVGCCGLLCLLG